MRKALCIALVTIACVSATSAQASGHVTLHEGFGITLERITDAMTDEQRCAMFVRSGPIYFAVEGRSKVVIWANSDDVHFAPDSTHLLRIGQSQPTKLVYLPKRNGLAPATPETAAKIVSALANHDSLKVRFFDWPSHEPVDVTVDSPAFPYVWGIAMKQCKWPSLGVPAQLPKAALRVYEPNDESSKKGYARVSVVGNDDLSLTKGFDQYGGGCQFSVGVHAIAGRFKGSWTTETADMLGDGKLVVYDKDGAVAFEARFPKTFGGIGGTAWDRAETALKSMWQVAPYGSVSVKGVSYPQDKVPLYGFREMYGWAEQKCGFPSLNGPQ